MKRAMGMIAGGREKALFPPREADGGKEISIIQTTTQKGKRHDKRYPHL
ncbi:MAG: hypothetical protein V1721_04120 [Pseudomonadota bacterium]